MPAHIVRAILISVGVIAALGLAVYENPEVQQWLDEQRRKLATLLRNIGDDLDPQSRREAEAFAYGAAPSPHVESSETATTTGVDLENNTVRRIPVQGSVSDAQREERQRLGQEYLARRSQNMIEMQQRRARSFDTLVDEEGKLKEEEQEEIERSETPRPVVPPKIKLEDVEPMPIEDIEEPVAMPGTLSLEQAEERAPMPGALPLEQSQELPYEDQLAIALMQSAEPQPDFDEEEFRKAIELSLRDVQGPDHVDVCSFGDPAVSVPPSEADTEDLYYATPNLTRASLAALDVQHPALQPEAPGQKTPTEASSFAFDTDSTMSEAIEVTDAVSEASESGIKTPDSWSEIGSHDAAEMHAA